MEVSGHLVGSAAFKAVGTGDPRPAGSIPVHLRQGTTALAALHVSRMVRWTCTFTTRESIASQRR